ncbi:FecR domain-containing protein [Haloferula sp.]|uniref:FecR domain-containing protein n=1 Tax=Haloferula sp. TaxID=2497595 RepID=UPI00329B0A9C
MRPVTRIARSLLIGIACLATWETAHGQNATVLEIENIVQTNAGGRSSWQKAKQKQSLAVGDRIRTRHRSRTTVGLTGLYTVRLDQFTTVEITPALVSEEKPKLDLLGGAAFIFSREKEGEIDIRMPGANAALRGTQLLAKVLPNGKSFVQVLEGSVELGNKQGRLLLNAGEAGEAFPGQAPQRTAVIEAKNILQWALYYPAVIDPADLGMTGGGSKSLNNYRRGNLLGAVETLPANAPADANGRLYHAGVLMSVGRVDEARKLLNGVPKNHSGRRALERMIAAVFQEPAEAWRVDEIGTASEAMAESYYQQSKAMLEPARKAAMRATELAPNNGFAWTRLAELEFSSGRTKAARAAIEKGQSLTPENARTHALRGFILSSENRIDEAREAFETSVELDGSFGNGWLGLGLTKIKKGELEEGRRDLQTAATVEPTSSIFHSYLGKAMSQDGRPEEAAKDLEFAKLLDPNDPTPLLYSAIENQLNNRTNAAIADLEKSIELNDNRRLYRSEFLLDQDRAVRSANLARIYQNAGMNEVAVREATRAVEADYTSASAHLFLSNSFDALRDPDRVLLRYETPWFNELLLSNLLSPVGGGALSQFVSQQEYSKLLEADGMGGSITTHFRDDSEIRTALSVFGTEGNFSYGIDYYNRHNNGDRPNSDFDLQEIYGQFKWQATPDDIFYFLGKWATQETGDNFQTYNNQPLSTQFRFEENQEPGILLAGWNHRWSPQSNTLLLVGRLSADQTISDPLSNQLLIERDTSGMRPDFIQAGPFGFDQFTDPSLNGSVTLGPDGSFIYSPELLQSIAPYIGTGNVVGTSQAPFEFYTRREFEIYTAELQHIWKTDNNTLLLGGRWQEGTIETAARLSVVRPTFVGGFATPAADQFIESDYRRTGLYAYDYWNVLPCLTLIGGVTWDSIDHPQNFRNPPVNNIQNDDSELSGKLGFTYAPTNRVTFRGMYAEGLGGLTFDESVRLEPTQLAGFNQAYRTVISESLVGSVETPTYQISGLSAEGSFPTRTWWGVTFNMIEQDVDRTLGAFTGYDSTVFPSTAYFPDGTTQNLNYEEQSIALTLNQLIGEEFSLGTGYRFTNSELQTSFPELQGQPGSYLRDEATLHQFSLYGNWNSSSGWFAHLEANSFHQDVEDDPARGLNRSGDDFIQFNAWGGYRFNRNLCEITAGVMNIGDTDYQLSPLSPYGNIARERTFFVTCRLSF